MNTWDFERHVGRDIAAYLCRSCTCSLRNVAGIIQAMQFAITGYLKSKRIPTQKKA